MNNKCRLPLLIALTIALAACGDDKNANYTGMGDNGGALPGGSDQVNPGGDASGIPPSPRGDFNPETSDYQTLPYILHVSITLPRSAPCPFGTLPILESDYPRCSSRCLL